MNEYPTEEVEKLEVLEEEESKRGRLWRVLRIPLFILLLLGAIGGTWWFLSRQKPEAADAIIEAPQEVMREERTPPPFGEVYMINDIILNPSGGRLHFMVSIGLEYFDIKKTEEIKRREPLLRDNLITFFGSQPLEVLTNIRYRQAIRSRVKKIMDYQLGEGVISRVFFNKWVF